MMVNIFSLAVLIIRPTCFTILRFHKFVKLTPVPFGKGLWIVTFGKLYPYTDVSELDH